MSMRCSPSVSSRSSTRRAGADAVVRRDARDHPPTRAAWYLGVVGVRPEQHGQGLGGAVIRAVLDGPIAVGAPAYLVTGTERNLAIYRRLGFDVIAETDLRAGPHLWGMWRPASA